MTSVNVHVDGRPQPIQVHITPNHTLYQIRRAVARACQLSPESLHITPSAGVDVPQTLQCRIRTRHNSLTITVTPYVGSAFNIPADPSDTIMDLKFLLSSLTGLSAESHHISFGAAELSDHLVISRHGYRLWYEIPSSIPGRGTAHRSSHILLTHTDPSRSTLQSMLNHSFEEFHRHRLLGSRVWNDAHTIRGQSYTWQSYRDISTRCRLFAGGLQSLGLQPGDKIGIMSMNRPEWAITDFTCMLYGYVSVTLYDTLGPDVVKYIVNHAELKAVVVSQQMIPELVKVRPLCQSLQYVIMMDDLPIDRCYHGPGYTHTMSQIQLIGSKLESIPFPSLQPDDIASICYTSGTTGNPKGVLISHGNLVSATTAINAHVTQDGTQRLQPGLDTTISYLPLAHIYERIAHLSALTRGIGIGYFSGDTTLLLDDVSILAPTVFPGVPRVWQRIYDRVNSQINESSWLTRRLFQAAYDTKLAALRSASKGSPDTGLLDSLVFKKIAGKFGGNLSLMISGSAPISARVATFMRICMRAAFIEGYGLTETCAITLLTPLSDTDYGHVGFPSGCCEAMLVDVESMSYLTSDQPSPRGEVWIRGPNVCKGYYKQEKVTAESMTTDGWFKTGDIGRWRPDGRLEIIDRLKNIFKLSQGEYIRPEHIEGVYKMSPLIANIFVYGDSLQQYLVAIIVPNHEEIAKLKIGSDKVKLNAVIEKDMGRYAVKEGLRGFEQVRRFTLIDDDFTVENDLLTPSMKLKRHEAKTRFAKLIEEMYSGPEASPVSKL